MAVGLDSTGMNIRRFEDIMKDTKAKMQDIFGAELILDDSSPDNQQLAVSAYKYAELWETLLMIWSQLDPNSAIGNNLDLVNEGLRGVPRLQPARTRVTCTIVGTPTTVIPAGSIVSSSVNSLLSSVTFSTMFEVTIPGGGSVPVVVECSANGTYEVNALDIDTINNPIAGWTSISNAGAGTTGTDLEVDQDYRKRGNRSQALPSQSMIESLIAGLYSLDGVAKVKIYENRDSVADANGVPAHSIAVYVIGGINQEIGEMIFLRYNLGPGLEGDQVVTVYDSLNNSYTINFYRPTNNSIEVEVDVKEVSGWVLGNTELIKEAVIAYFNGELVQQGVESGYEIGDGVTVYGADLYAPVAVINGLRINSIKVREKLVGGAYLNSVDMEWNEYPVVVDADITVIHNP